MAENQLHQKKSYKHRQCILHYPFMIDVETVLGKAAMYFNARMPELTSVQATSPEEISDFEEVIDEFTGEVRALICIYTMRY